MESDNNAENNIEMWECLEEEFSLQRDPELDVAHCLWNDMNQDDNSLLYILEEQTPIKDCADFGYGVLDVRDKTNKGLEECRDSSQLKRRRMLQFTSDANDTGIGNEQISSASENSKVMENSLFGDEFLECLEWNPEWNSSFSGDRRVFGNEGLDQSSEGWLANCFNESEMHCSPCETSSCMNDSVASDDQVEVSEFGKIPPEMENVVVQENPHPALCRIFRGRKSFMKTPTKLTTSVAYPFTLIKPCGVQGDVTLKDINQWIHAPPPSKSKHKKNEDPSLLYPTSAFSGKPVVVKTKIHTEGGKGSITIMRTKG